MRHLLRILLIFVITSPALAQHDHSVPNSSIFNFESLQRMYPFVAPPKSEPVFPPPSFIEKKAPAKEETRLSYWGFGHKRLHAGGVIDEIVEKTGNKCCNGVHSGECRITTLNMSLRTVDIDGETCPLNPDIKIVDLETFDDIGFAIVCAAPSEGKLKCPAQYCLGRKQAM